MSFTKKDRNFRTTGGNMFPPGGSPPGGTTFAAGMAVALRQAYGGRHSAVKVVAAAVGANERAVRNWFDGKNGPNGEYLVRLVRHSDEILDSFLAFAGKKRPQPSLELAKARSALERALRALNSAEDTT